jgi:hypothetical protein
LRVHLARIIPNLSCRAPDVQQRKFSRKKLKNDPDSLLLSQRFEHDDRSCKNANQNPVGTGYSGIHLHYVSSTSHLLACNKENTALVPASPAPAKLKKNHSHAFTGQHESNAERRLIELLVPLCTGTSTFVDQCHPVLLTHSNPNSSSDSAAE